MGILSESRWWSRRRRARVEIPFAGCLMRQSTGVIKCQTNAERESRSERLPTARHGRYTVKRRDTILAQAITLYKHATPRLQTEERADEPLQKLKRRKRKLRGCTRRLKPLPTLPVLLPSVRLSLSLLSSISLFQFSFFF